VLVAVVRRAEVSAIGFGHREASVWNMSVSGDHAGCLFILHLDTACCWGWYNVDQCCRMQLCRTNYSGLVWDSVATMDPEDVVAPVLSTNSSGNEPTIAARILVHVVHQYVSKRSLSSSVQYDLSSLPNCLFYYIDSVHQLETTTFARSVVNETSHDFHQ
jgi:hypothetical protein